MMAALRWAARKTGLGCWCCGRYGKTVLAYRWNPYFRRTWCRECKFTGCEHCAATRPADPGKPGLLLPQLVLFAGLRVAGVVFGFAGAAAFWGRHYLGGIIFGSVGAAYWFLIAPLFHRGWLASNECDRAKHKAGRGGR